MTVDKLIQILADYRDEFGGDTEVRLVSQPAWPFEYSIHGLTKGQEINERDGDAANDDAVIYIVEGNQLGYGSKQAWENARSQP